MMKQKLKIYDDYKDSKVEWIGETPLQWEVVRNKDIFVERGSLSNSGTETLLTVSHITGVTRRDEKNVNMFMAETMEGYKLCEKGDLIINTMWAWMGALGTSNEDGICSPAYGVYKPRKCKPYYHRYFDYLYRIPASIMEMTRYSKGIVSSRLRLYPKDFFQIQTALPNYDTQKAIADYLDTKTAQFDRKIELLNEKANQYYCLKQSLINETLTHGLDKTVAMKDSGVEWIGNVPAHWKAKRGCEIFSLGNKTVTTSEMEGREVFHYSIPVVQELGTGQFEEGSSIDSNKALVTGNELLYSKLNPRKETVCITSEVDTSILTVASGEFLVLKPLRNRVLLKFGYYLFKANFNKEQICSTVKSVTKSHQRANPADIYKMIQYIPPIQEQKVIVDYLDEKTAQIDLIVKTIYIQIDKLKEIRKTLINDVVTGKIKVTTEGAKG